MINLFFIKSSSPSTPVATSRYRQLVQAMSDGLWGFIRRQLNWDPPINVKDPLELAQEERRQRLLSVCLAIGSVVIVCVLLWVITREPRLPQGFDYAKGLEDHKLRKFFTHKPREDLIDSIDTAIAGCEDEHANQLWADLTHQISEQDGGFAQSLHLKCQCIDQLRETPGLFHVLYHADETVADDILGKLGRLSGLMSCQALEQQTVNPTEGSRGRPRQNSAGGSPWRPCSKELGRLQKALSSVRCLQQWQSRRKELLKLTDKFNKAVVLTQHQLFCPGESFDFETLRRDIPIMRDVLRRLKQFEDTCKKSSLHVFLLNQSDSSKIFRCGQFDVNEYYQAALYEGASRTVISDADLASLTVQEVNRIVLQTAHIRTRFAATEPESSDAIEEAVRHTNEAKNYTRQARLHLQELNTRSFFRTLLKTRLAYAIKAVVASVVLVNSLVFVLGFHRFRSMSLSL